MPTATSKRPNVNLCSGTLTIHLQPYRGAGNAIP